MQQFFKNKNIFIIPLAIFCLALFLRTYNLENIYVFNLDEEYQATYAWTQVLDFHPIWIGVNASFLNFYLGPYFTYLTALFLKISNGDPLITAYFAAIVGALISVVIFFIGRYFFNLITGITAGVLYSTLPLFVFFDQKYWNPMFNLLIILLIFVSLNLVRKSKWWWILFSLCVGAIFHLHLATLPFVLVGAWYFMRGKYFKDLKLVLVCLVAFLFLYWPLIIFDLNHNFSNVTFFMSFKDKANQSKLKFDPLAKMDSMFDSLGRLWYLKPGAPNADEINFGCTSLSGAIGSDVIDRYTSRTYASIWLSFVSLTLFAIFLWRNFRSKNFSIKLLTIFLLSPFIFYLIYPGASFEYYTLGFLMLFTFIPGLLISDPRNRYKITPLFLLLLVIFLGINTVLKTSDEFSLGPKKQIINQVMRVVQDKPFEIEGRGICHDYEGWRYLFKVYGRVPSQSYTDQTFSWLYPDEVTSVKPEYTVILSEDRIPLSEDLSSLQSFKAGGYKAYIRKN